MIKYIEKWNREIVLFKKSEGEFTKNSQISNYKKYSNY